MAEIIVTDRRGQEIRFAEPARRPKGGEAGFTGLDVWDGLITDDYNANLRGSDWIETCEKMRRGDGQVQAVELALTLPIRSATWSVEPPDGEDAGSSAKEAAEGYWANLQNTTSHTWDDHIREACVGMLQGYQVFEKVWNADGSYRKFPVRGADTIEKWVFDPQGGLAGFKQQGTDTSGKFREITIPIEKLLVFTYRKERGNPEGFGLLRPAYKHWKILDSLYRIANIGFEHVFLGMPYAMMAPGASADDRRKTLKILKNWRAAENGAAAFPKDTVEELSTLEMKGDISRIDTYMKHHLTLIARSALAQFISFGDTRFGGQQVTESMTKFFLLNLNASAQWFAQVHNRYAIPQWVEYNAPGLPREEWPELKHEDLGLLLHRDDVAEMLKSLIEAQVLTAGEDIEGWVREIYNLPEKEEQGSEEQGKGKSADSAEEEDAGDKAAAREGRQSAIVLADKPSPSEVIVPPEYGLQDEFQERARAVVGKLHEKFLKRLEPLLAKLAKATKSNAGTIIREIGAVEVPHSGEYAGLLRDFMTEVWTQATQRYAERGNVPVPPTPNWLAGWKEAKAASLEGKHGEDLRFAVVADILNRVNVEAPLKELLMNAEQVMREVSTKALTEHLEEAAGQMIGKVAG